VELDTHSSPLLDEKRGRTVGYLVRHATLAAFRMVSPERAIRENPARTVNMRSARGRQEAETMKLETLKHPASTRAVEALGFVPTYTDGNLTALDHPASGVRLTAGAYGNGLAVLAPATPKTEKKWKVDILSEGAVVGARVFDWDHEAKYFRDRGEFPESAYGPVTAVDVPVAD